MAANHRVISFIQTDSFLDPRIVLEFLVFNPIFYASLLVITLSIVKASLNWILDYLITTETSVPTLYYKESTFSRFLLRKIPRLTDVYRTPRWCLNPDVQYFSSLIFADPKASLIKFNRQFFQLKDRGLVALDWVIPATSFCNLNYCVWNNLKKNKPILLILPDFNSSAMSLGFVCQEALSRGFRPTVFHRRGHGGCPLTTPKLQQYGDPYDLRQTIQYLRSSSPTVKLLAVGYGIGSDLLFSYLGEFGSSSFMSACVAISPLYDPEQIFRQGLRQPYSVVSSLAYKKLIGTHVKALRNTADINKVLRETIYEAESILHSQSIVTSPNKLDCNLSYWERNAPLRDVDDISTPMLCVSSVDDPFLTKNSIPFELFRLYPNLVLALTEYGGHCAFLHDQLDVSKADHGWPWKVTSWADLLALNFLQATMEFAAMEDR